MGSLTVHSGKAKLKFILHLHCKQHIGESSCFKMYYCYIYVKYVQPKPGRAVSHVCGLPPSSQHPATGSGIWAFGAADPLLNLHCLQALLPKEVFHQLWWIFPISSFYKVQDHHKTHCIYLKVGLVWILGTTEQQSDWTQTEFLQRAQVAIAELPYLPSYKQPGETRVAKLKHQVLLLKSPSRGARGSYAS